MKERFKTVYIDGEESNYMISNKGRCVNFKSGKFLKPHKLARKNKVLVPIDPDNCYYDYALFHKGKYHYKQIGRLVAEYFVPIPDKYLVEGLTMKDLEADHINEYRPDNRSTNLQWLTREENYRKMLNSGHFRVATGSNHGNCKLNDIQLDMVGQLLHNNELTPKQISEVTNVPVNTIHEICAKRRFAYLHEKYDISNYNAFGKKPIAIEKIRHVMELLQDTDLPMTKIAEKVGVSKSTVKDIYKGRSHKDMLKDYDFSERELRNANM